MPKRYVEFYLVRRKGGDIVRCEDLERCEDLKRYEDLERCKDLWLLCSERLFGEFFKSSFLDVDVL